MKGFTLIELMISVALLILILSTTIPSLGNLSDSYQAKTASSTLKKIFQTARTRSFESEISLTVCPVKHGRCSHDWSNKITVFSDSNNDQVVDQNEVILLQTFLNNTSGYWLKKRANDPYIRFNAQGHAFASATTFLYCPYSGNNSAAKQLIINFQGRIRLKNYLTTKGKPYSTVAPLSCG